jgi:hypothetical protein
MVDENVFLAHAFFIGIYITFVYDLLRILRRVVPHSSFWVSVEDLAFWVYCAGKVFLLMHHESDGTLRWFAVLGALVGMLLYRKTVGALFVKYMSLALIKVRDFCIKICKMVCKPFCAAGKKVTGVLGKAVKKAGPESTKRS